MISPLRALKQIERTSGHRGTYLSWAAAVPILQVQPVSETVCLPIVQTTYTKAANQQTDQSQHGNNAFRAETQTALINMN